MPHISPARDWGQQFKGKIKSMTQVSKIFSALSAIALATGAMAAPAQAEHDDGDRKWSFSFNVGATSNYIFRGVSQSDNDPAFQAGVDVTYGMFYIGAWGSGVDASFVGNASAEIDLYAGITPSWGILDFDFGVIYYGYPGYDKFGGANPSGGVDVDYWELKAGVSTDDLIKNLSLGVTFYYTPEGTFETGEIYIVEGSAGYTLPAFAMFTPTISGGVGTVQCDDDPVNGGCADYTYWNAGVELAVEKLSFDFRYWDTDIDVINAAGTKNLSDGRFVFTGKFTY